MAHGNVEVADPADKQLPIDADLAAVGSSLSSRGAAAVSVCVEQNDDQQHQQDQ